ncbi:MAG: aminotransferase class IV [Thermoleophilia bacterium]|nr:aminotransferase class IV [Thermoleophilia bacterium]
MTLLGLAVSGRGAISPDEPVLYADDLGLLRGLAAFETLRVYDGRPFRMDEHLARLSASAERIGIPTVDPEALSGLATDALAAAGVDDCALRLYWTGGREGTGTPTALALVSALPPGLEERRARGLRAVALTLPLDTRQRSEPWMLAGVKSTSYALNMAAETEARRQGGDDAVFVSTDGWVLEGPVTNVWWRRSTVLFTPTLELGILAGVTRGHVLAAASELGYEVEEGRYGVADLAAAEEAFSSSSVREIMPIVSLDGRPIGDGEPGPAAGTFQAALRAAARRA